MSALSLEDGKIVMKYLKKGVEVTKMLDPMDHKDETLKGIYTATRNLVAHLIVSKGKWTGNVQDILVPLIKELVEFAQGYKYLSGRNKKELVIVMVREIIEKELGNAEVEEDVVALIKGGVGSTLEPAIDLAVFAAGQIRLSQKQKNALRNMLSCFRC